MDAVTFSDFFRATLSVPYMLPPMVGCSKEPCTIGEHLRKRRMDLGLYQREVAEKIGVGECTVHNWEQGIEPALRYMPKILDFLGYVPFDCPESEDVMERLAYFKLVNGMNFRKLGDLMGIHHEQLTDWLGGKIMPSKKNIERINKFLSTRLDRNR